MNTSNLFAFIAATAVAITTAGCETVKTTNAGAVGVDRKQQMLVPSETIDQGAARGLRGRTQGRARQGCAQYRQGAARARDHHRQAHRRGDTGVPPRRRRLELAVQRAEDQGAERLLHAGRTHHGLFGAHRKSRSVRCGARHGAGSRESRTRCANTRANACRVPTPSSWCCRALPQSRASAKAQPTSPTWLPKSRSSCRSVASRNPRRIRSASSSWRAPATTRVRRSRCGTRWLRQRHRRQPKFLSTHPAPKERIKDIEKNLPRVLPLYAKRN